MKKGLMLLACGLLIGAVTACGQTKPDDGMDFEQNTNVPEVVYNVSIVGTKWANWDAAASGKDENCQLKKTEDPTIYAIETDITTNDGFKIILDGGWSTQYGMEDIDWEKSTEGLLVGKKEDYNGGATTRSDIKVTRDTTIRVEYHPYYFINKECSTYLVIKEVNK